MNRPPAVDAETLAGDPAGLGRLALGDAGNAVSIRVDARARRLALRVDPRTATVKLTVPPRAGREPILHFVRRHIDWIERRLAELDQPVPFAPQAVVPVLGTPVTLTADPTGRRVAVRDGDRLLVGGDPACFAARVTDWLKAEARRHLSRRTAELAGRLGARATAVAVRDTVSRWGSCSAKGRIGYCWRLILAPAWVVDYVVAHEVAHLSELNHSPRFWRLVEDLAGDPRPARRWLRSHGAGLHRYGQASPGRSAGA